MRARVLLSWDVLQLKRLYFVASCLSFYTFAIVNLKTLAIVEA